MNSRKRFWDVYNSNSSNGQKLEDIMDRFDIETFTTDSGDWEFLNPYDYDKVMEEYDEMNCDTPSDETFIEELRELLESSDRFNDVSTFEERGLLTKNMGLCININGKEFELALLGSWK